MICDCPICNGRDFNADGITLADKEVIPEVKRLLNLRYDRPFPLKYRGLLASLFAYSQTIAYHRIHKEPTRRYYTDSIWLLQLKDSLNSKFKEVVITNATLIDQTVREVCEFNISQYSKG